MFRLGDGASWVLVVLVLLVGIAIGDGLHGGSTPADRPLPSPTPWTPPAAPGSTVMPPIHYPDSDFQVSPSPS